MSNLNQLELQNLRHLIGAHETVSNKLNDFANQCTDPNIKEMLMCDAQDAKTNKEKLMNFLK